MSEHTLTQETSLPADAEAVLRVIRTRRSHPHVLPAPEPSRRQIELLLEAANTAPNHHLTQPWRFFVLRGDERLRLGQVVTEAGLKRWPAKDPQEEEHRRAEGPRRFARAPIVIAVAAAPPGHPHVGPWEELAATSAAIQNMLLAAHAMGLAGYWRSNGTGLPEVAGHFGLPEDSQIVGFVYIGYPDPNAQLADRPRKPYCEFVQWRGWDDAEAAR